MLQVWEIELDALPFLCNNQTISQYPLVSPAKDCTNVGGQVWMQFLLESVETLSTFAVETMENHSRIWCQSHAPGRAEVPCSPQSYISPADTCCYCLSVLSNLISPNSIPHIFKRHFEYQWCLEIHQTWGLRQLTCKDQCILSLPTVLSQMSFIFSLCDVLLGNQMQINITLEKMEKEDIITFI